ncbi:acyl carrier protein [Paraburkholderia sp. ZP32-5]|uniref:acyl carrier protein n=1 Tax=Paraburkholderia sp. ZP32-5 TaxID=2883245 RepID=UPI001F4386FE|nr:phosphopantetheine-binding protein [Paraburkholderia sp. ZP32-5]
MDNAHKVQIRAFVANALRDRGDNDELADDESLFISGRLDSLSMLMLVSNLEAEFDIDFATFDFDVNLIDSVDEIAALVRDRAALSRFHAS